MEDFVENVLPKEQENETFLIALFARNKYSPGLGLGDKSCLKRVTSKKKDIIDKIRQMEIAVGSYKGNKKQIIPQEALALYITINPRNLEKAAKKSLIKLAEVITQKYNGYNPHQLVMSEIQKSKGKTTFIDFDFDGVDVYDFDSVLPKDSYKILKTRGGYHLLVKVDAINKNDKNWYTTITQMNGCDVCGDSLIPVPGCTQGNFTPHFI